MKTILFGKRNGWDENLLAHSNSEYKILLLNYDELPISVLILFCQHHRVTCIIPCTEKQGRFLIQYHKILYNNLVNINIIVSQYKSSIDVLENKYQFYLELQKLHLEHYLPKHYIGENKNLPVIFKPAIGQYGIGCCIVDNNDLWLKSWSYFSEHYGNGNFIQQEYLITKKEYTWHAYITKMNYEIKWQLTLGWDVPSHYWVKGSDEDEKNPIKPYVINRISKNDELIFIKILKHIGYMGGMVSLNFKYNDKMELKILEINPRLGGSLINSNNNYLYSLFSEL